MKNKFYIFLLLILIIFKNSFANELKFETTEIEVNNNGNLIYATEGKAISADNNLEISANNFIYTKDIGLLKAFKGEALFKSENLKIKFNEISLDQKKQFLTAKENVEIYDLKKKLLIESELINYDKKKNIIESPVNSIITDKNKNVLKTKNFKYETEKNILKIKNAKLRDIKNNIFEIELAYINTISNQLIGKDVNIDLDNKDFNLKNEPRLKGKSVIIENDYSEISKGVFTTCQKNDDCPPWVISAEKIQHNKKKQIINYKNAWLKVYDVPVMYFPKFFHPDPTVKRQSGFLIPKFKSSANSKSYLSVPYYNVISLNKDMTFTPRFYTDEKFLLQTEYRQVNKDSTQNSDFSLLKEKGKNSKSHFFYKVEKKLNFTKFDYSDLNLQIQKTSNNTYLKANKLTSPLIENNEVLESSIDFNLSTDDLSVNSELIVYEDLNKDNNSDKYEFILPKVDIVKSLDNKTNLDGNFLFKSSNLIRNYQTNIFEKTNINDLTFSSNPKTTKSGFYNNYDFIIKNVNSDTQNSTDFKENENYYLSGLIQLNSSLPLLKDGLNTQKILKPKMSLKMSPNNTKDISNKERRLDVNNIYNLNRLSTDTSVEGGISFVYGNDFTIFDKNQSREIFGLKLANNLRFEENDDLPKNNQIGSKTSNFFGEIEYSPSKFLTTKYNTSLKNNLSDINYENFTTEINVNNFVTTFDYLNENNTLDKNTYLQNTTKYNFDDSNNIMFSTRRNKKTDLTEYYNFMYQYKNDCLAASIEYNKDYYSDRDVKPEESVFFKLTIIPFGETSSPNLKN